MPVGPQQTWSISSYACISEGVEWLFRTGNPAGYEAMRIVDLAHAILSGYFLFFFRLADVSIFRFRFSVRERE